MIILNQALAAFMLFLPAGVANMAPVIANKIPGLNRWKTPLDFGKTYRGKRIFGDNKTWRGLLTGSIFGGVIWVLLASGYDWPAGFIAHTFAFGVWLGLGALVGDAVESFFKRQRGVPSGDSWLPWDQLDYIIGAILFSLVFVREPIMVYVLTVVIYFGLHLLVSYIAYLLGLKDKPI